MCSSDLKVALAEMVVETTPFAPACERTIERPQRRREEPVYPESFATDGYRLRSESLISPRITAVRMRFSAASWEILLPIFAWDSRKSLATEAIASRSERSATGHPDGVFQAFKAFFGLDQNVRIFRNVWNHRERGDPLFGVADC